MFLKLHIDNHSYFSDELNQSIDNFLKNDSLSLGSISERNGKAKTTSHIDDGKILFSILGFDRIYSEVSNSLLKTKHIFNKENCNKILYTRIWMNEMFKNSSGKIHTHDGDNDGVAIFYYKAPKNSGRFVIVDEENFIEEKLNIDEYSHNELSFIKVSDGDLLVHNSSLPHGVSEHLSDETRICFIFNFKFIE